MIPFVVGVAGGSGSGKTTVSQRIRDAIGAEHIVYLQHDSYYYDLSHLPLDQRVQLNYDHPESLDTPLLVEHLARLRNGVAVEVPLYDFATYTRLTETRIIQPAPIILLEGILIFAEHDLRALMDLCVFVDTADDLRFIRRLRRDTVERGRTLDSIIEQYLSAVRPMHLKFVEPSKAHADIILPVGGHNEVAMALIVSRLQMVLADWEKQRGE